MANEFAILNQQGAARAGALTTISGRVNTPVFMPIATAGAVKGMLAEEVADLGAQIILGNTYHLILRPGLEALKKLGGIKNLMNWSAPLLTDSGGYQVYSLSKLTKLREEGVEFSSHLDGSKLLLTPESSIQAQGIIGADIMMQLDQVLAGGADYADSKLAMERSLRWAERCLATRDSDYPHRLLFGIVQGGSFLDLRERSAEGLKLLGFDGYAIGGLSVGEERADCYRVVKKISALLPVDQPRYFMGGGMPEEILYYVSQGVDMFDCVLPTRNARHGQIFLWKEDPKEAVKKAFALAQTEAPSEAVAEALYNKVNITNESYILDASPLDQWSDYLPGQQYSRAYLRHLFRAEELLGLRLASGINLAFYLRMMRELRGVIMAGGNHAESK